MKRALSIVLDLLALGFLVGAMAVEHFTAAKLGMRRWVNYHTMRFQELLPLDVLKYIALAAVIVAALAVALWCWRARARLARLEAVPVACLLAVCGVYAYCTVGLSLETCASYYLVMPLCGLAALMLIARNTLAAAGAGGE